jgi:hypothetical protein
MKNPTNADDSREDPESAPPADSTKKPPDPTESARDLAQEVKKQLDDRRLKKNSRFIP